LKNNGFSLRAALPAFAANEERIAAVSGVDIHRAVREANSRSPAARHSACQSGSVGCGKWILLQLPLTGNRFLCSNAGTYDIMKQHTPFRSERKQQMMRTEHETHFSLEDDKTLGRGIAMALTGPETSVVCRSGLVKAAK
jgi:hypothetical protein